MSVKSNLICSLGIGKKNAKTRAQLAQELGISDRMLRRYVNQSRKDGRAIISTSDGTGYYLAANDDEIQHLIAELLSRARDHYSTATALGKLITDPAQTQMEI